MHFGFEEEAMRTSNNGNKLEIRRSARELFAEKGYSATLMKEIAEKAGVTKALVQYYYPHKELFVTEFTQDMLDAADDYLNDGGFIGDDYYANLLLVGNVHFAYLLESEKMKGLTPEIVASRSITEGIIDLEIEWASTYMDHGEAEDWADGIAIIMGGAYDMIYRSIQKKKQLSPRKLIERCVRFLMLDQGQSERKINSTLAQRPLSDEQLNAVIKYLDGELFGK